jgi:uncharacterized protein
MRPYRRPLLAGLAALLAAMVAVGATGCAYLATKERELVYRPVRDSVRTPADVGLRYDEVWIDVAKEDGSMERIHAWWLPAARAEAPAVLYLHGVRWSLGNNLFRLNRWHQLGFNVLAIDYRGFGRSDGDLPSELQIHADARAAWGELVRREPRADMRFIYGHSLGAAVALDLATRTDDATGVIAEAGFTSLPDVVAGTNRAVSLLVTQRFDSLARVRELKVPSLFVHGTADNVVPPAMSEALYAAAPEPKRLLMIEGANHGNWNGVGLDDWARAIDEFVGVARSTQRARTVAAGAS